MKRATRMPGFLSAALMPGLSPSEGGWDTSGMMKWMAIAENTSRLPIT